MTIMQSLMAPVKNLLNLGCKKGKIPDVSGQQLKCEGIVNRSVPVHNNIPEPSHQMDLFLHGPADKIIIQEVHQDVLVVTGYAECQIRVDDGADIKHILNCKFCSLVYPVLHKAKGTELPCSGRVAGRCCCTNEMPSAISFNLIRITVSLRCFFVIALQLGRYNQTAGV